MPNGPIFKDRIKQALDPNHLRTFANAQTGWMSIGGANDLKVAFNNIADRHDRDITVIEKQGRVASQAQWCEKWEMTAEERSLGGHDAYSNQFWYQYIAQFLFFYYRMALIDLTYFCVNSNKLDFPSNMPNVGNGEDLSIYRAGKLYSFDGRNAWAVQGKHVNDACNPRGTKGEPIFFNADLTPTTYTYMGISLANCYGAVVKRAIKNIWRTDKNDNDAPINLLLKLTTDDNICSGRGSCDPAANRPRGCKNLSKTLQEKFQKVMILYILTEYSDISTYRNYAWRGATNKSMKDMLYYKINENIGTTMRPTQPGANRQAYDEQVMTSIDQFINEDLLRKNFQKQIPMTKSVKGYHCDTKRHGASNRRFLFHIFQAYGDDHYRRSYHYDDRVYVEVQFQVLRAMQEVLRRVSRGVDNDSKGMLKHALRTGLGLNTTAECRIIGTWADYTPRGRREREGGRPLCTAFDLEVVIPLKEFDATHRYKTFKSHNSWTEFYAFSHSPPHYAKIDPKDAYEIINRATGGTFLPDRSGFGIPCISEYPYLTVSGNGRLALGDALQGRNPPFNAIQLHQFFPQHHQAPQQGFVFNNNNFQNQNVNPFAVIFHQHGQQNQGFGIQPQQNQGFGGIAQQDMRDGIQQLQQQAFGFGQNQGFGWGGGDGTNNTYGLGSRIFDEVENNENKEILIKLLKLFYKKIKNSNDIVKDITNPSLTIKNSSVDKINTDEVKDYFNSITDEKSISVIIEFIQYHYGIRLVVTKKYMNYMRTKLLNDTLFDLNDKNYTDSEPKNIKEILSKIPTEDEEEISESNKSKNMIIPKMKTGHNFYTRNKGNIYNVTEPYNSFNQLSAPMMVAGKKRKTRRKKRKTRRKKRKTRRKVHKKTRRKVNKKKKTRKRKFHKK